ncbi:MAG: hypothetical protein AB7T10_05790 [bacterium]
MKYIIFLLFVIAAASSAYFLFTLYAGIELNRPVLNNHSSSTGQTEQSESHPLYVISLIIFLIFALSLTPFIGNDSVIFSSNSRRSMKRTGRLVSIFSIISLSFYFANGFNVPHFEFGTGIFAGSSVFFIIMLSASRLKTMNVFLSASILFLCMMLLQMIGIITNNSFFIKPYFMHKMIFAGRFDIYDALFCFIVALASALCIIYLLDALLMEKENDD